VRRFELRPLRRAILAALSAFGLLERAVRLSELRPLRRTIRLQDPERPLRRKALNPRR